MRATNLFFAMIIIMGYGSLNAQTKIVSSPTNTQFSCEPWLEDFHQLIAEMDSHYANLDWAIRYRHMNLPKLRADTEAKIRNARDDQNAKQAIEEFIRAFGDGHLSISWPSTQAESSPSEPRTAPAPLCSRLGFHSRSKPGIEFSSLPNFVAAPGKSVNLFPGGILTLPTGKIGVIRIADFNERGYPLACENVVKEMHLQDDSPCDGKCDNAVTLNTANFLTKSLIARAHQLCSLGASALLVDITHNDGGDDWNGAVVRSLSPIPLVEERRGFIKHPMWTRKLTRELRSVQKDLHDDAEPRQVLQKAADRLQQDIDLSKQTCDRSSAFIDGTIHCSLVVDGGLYWSGVLPYAKPGAFPHLQSRTILFNPFQYDYIESAQHLPLYVAVDAHTWSSAERFAALLQDNHAATLIGELTGGAGCGIVDGGIPTPLAHSHGHVNIPNCVGFRYDGSNANAGVTPDILLPWAARDTPYLRAEKLQLALMQAMQSKPSKHTPAP